MMTSIGFNPRKRRLIIQHAALFTAMFALLFTAVSCGTKNMGHSPAADLDRAESAGAYRMLEAYDAPMAPAPMKAMRADIPREPSVTKKRMVHYNGYARMRSPKPEELIEKARSLVVESGGYVEQVRTGNAVFRVPVREFHGVFKKILTLGDVLSKNMSAQDVTDAFTDIDLKMKIATASRNRYLELLNQTDDEEEKLALLKEIARLNESIESMQNMLKTLSALADFSRLSLDVTGMESSVLGGEKPDIFEFRWIHELSPFSRANLDSGRKLKFEVPKDMVALGEKTWITESADGVVFSACRRANSPKGDTAFWISAVKERLEKGFRTMTKKQTGSFTCLRMESLSDKPYVYVLGLQVKDQDLQVFEIYYPGLDHETRFETAITDAIVKGAR